MNKTCTTCAYEGAPPESERCRACRVSAAFTEWVAVPSLWIAAEQDASEDRIDVIGANGNDGEHYDWIEWGGGKCPEARGVIVEVFQANFEIYVGPAERFFWTHEFAHNNIIRYRVVKLEPTLVETVAAMRRLASGAVDKMVDDIRAATAPGLLKRAAAIMEERAATYDKPEGERSMGATVTAFNAITGRDLKESEGWLLLQVLKDVRQWQRDDYHADSAEDCIAYSALKAEALAAGL